MPEWLIMYLAFAVAGGITTYFTVIREVNESFEEITETKSPLARYPFIAFIIWSVMGVVLAPAWSVYVLTGNIDLYRQRILKGWLKDAGFDD